MDTLPSDGPFAIGPMPAMELVGTSASDMREHLAAPAAQDSAFASVVAKGPWDRGLTGNLWPTRMVGNDVVVTCLLSVLVALRVEFVPLCLAGPMGGLTPTTRPRPARAHVPAPPQRTDGAARAARGRDLAAILLATPRLPISVAGISAARMRSTTRRLGLPLPPRAGQDISSKANAITTHRRAIGSLRGPSFSQPCAAPPPAAAGAPQRG